MLEARDIGRIGEWLSRDMQKNNTRRHIANLAAKLIAEEGVVDYAEAKRKAAKSLGVIAKELLPSNNEIEASVREHMAIFQSETQPVELYELRQVACQVMGELAHYNPQLVGPVWQGVANRFSMIEIDICADDIKAWEIFVLNKGWSFEVFERMLGTGCSGVTLIYQVVFDGVPVAITVFNSPKARTILRAHLGQGGVATLAELMMVMQKLPK